MFKSVLSFTGCMTLGLLLHLCEPQFLHCKKRERTPPHVGVRFRALRAGTGPDRCSGMY